VLGIRTLAVTFGGISASKVNRPLRAQHRPAETGRSRLGLDAEHEAFPPGCDQAFALLHATPGPGLVRPLS
jgi:hypothetical protein